MSVGLVDLGERVKPMPVTDIMKKNISFASVVPGERIQVRITAPGDASDICGIIQIAHGMAEHSGLYEDFAYTMAEQGFLVAANDHLGHGRSVSSGGAFGYFGEGGCHNLVSDMKKLSTILRQEHPDVPLILLGHSMGSFLVRDYLARFGTELAAAIILGTGEIPNQLVWKSQCLLAEKIVKKKGPKGHDPLFARLSTQRFNKFFASNRTPNDWLSRDTAEVDRYTADPLCGFQLTVSGYRDILLLQGEIAGEVWANKVPDIPILVLSGEKDPVGDFGKGVLRVIKALEATGHTVDWELYPEARHVLLCEINKTEVTHRILRFILEKAGIPQDEESL